MGQACFSSANASEAAVTSSPPVRGCLPCSGGTAAASTPTAASSPPAQPSSRSSQDAASTSTQPSTQPRRDRRVSSFGSSALGARSVRSAARSIRSGGSLASTPSSIDLEDIRSSTLCTRAILVEGDREKSIEELLRDLEKSAHLLERQYQSILRHPDADDAIIVKTNALTRRFHQQARRMKLRAARSWQMDGDGGDGAEWMTMLLGERKRFSSLQDVVKQVQLEGRIVRRWQEQNAKFSPLDDRLPDIGSSSSYTTINVDSWEAVDVFRLEADTQQPLKQVFMSIWKQRNLAQTSKATLQQIMELVSAVEASYRHNPYHNRMHAAEVTATAYYFWSQLAAQEHMKGYFSDVDLLVMTLSAAVHDMAHPGTGNDFLVKTEHPLALRYLDRSVLEHFHAASAFALMQEMKVPVLEHTMPSPPVETLKARIVDMLLATDMAQHRRVCEDMTSEVAVSKATQDIDKLKLEPFLLHLADIGHSFRPRALHKEWSLLIREEFFAQGDQERKLGLTPTPLCDRSKAPTLAKSQQGFLNFVMLPAWRPMSQVLGQAAAKSLDAYFCDNQAMWEEMANEELEKEQEEKAGPERLAISAAPSPSRAKTRKRTTTMF